MNIYRQNNLRGVINASGRMTKLGVSTISEEVGEVMVEAASNYVLIDELFEWSGAKIASLIGSVDSCVCASASSGIALSIASLICGNNLEKVKHFYRTLQMSEKREIILLKGHNIDFGAPIDTMIEAGGGKVVEVGYSNASSIGDIEAAINENTLAIFFVKSHHCVQKNMIDAQTTIALAKKHNIPSIIDAAAEEDLNMYTDMGADYVCYSGTKAISGPSSGFVACTSKEAASNMRLQYKGIGRTMKIGKENCMGLVKAVENYQKTNGYIPVVSQNDLKRFTQNVNQIVGLSAKIVQDEAGRNISRCQIDIDEKRFGVSATMLVIALEKNEPGIYTRDYQANLGSIAIDPRPLTSIAELDRIYLVLKRIQEVGK